MVSIPLSRAARRLGRHPHCGDHPPVAPPGPRHRGPRRGEALAAPDAPAVGSAPGRRDAITHQTPPPPGRRRCGGARARDLGAGACPLPQQSGTVDLLTQANVRFDGAAAGDGAGGTLGGAGDVNGDGRADVVVGAQLADAPGRANSGVAYVIFGQAVPTSVDLAALGSAGFRIDGAAADDGVGHSVAGAGDQNGDGRADLVVGAFGADDNGRAQSGSAYVVYGRPAPANVDLAALAPSAGFRIDGAAAANFLGNPVAGVGDQNGDGFADVAASSRGADNNGRADSGSVYVVLGGPSPGNVDTATLGAAGFRIDGAVAGDDTGFALDGAGDLDADGRADVAVGAPQADPDARVNAGSAFVVLGRTAVTPIDLAALGTSGIRIDGAAAGDLVGDALAGLGDLNGDGRADLAVPAGGADANGRTDSGSVHVVFGRTPLASIDLASPGAAGLRVDGAAAGDFAEAVAGPGDVKGDGRADLVVGASGADANGRSDSGSTHFLLGFGTPSLAYAAASATVGEPLVISPRDVRRTGPATFQISPGLPPGLAFEPGTGVLGGVPRSPLARTTFTVTITDLAAQASASVSLAIAARPGVRALVRCQGRRATIVGTARRDALTGTRRGDVIAALGGADMVRGRGGDDVVCLGAGNDRALGGARRDRVLGGAGRDLVRP